MVPKNRGVSRRSDPASRVQIMSKADAAYQTLHTESALRQLYASLGSIMGQYALSRDTFIVAARVACDKDHDAKVLDLTTPAAPRRHDAATPGALLFITGEVAGELTVQWPAVLGAGAYVADQRVEASTDASWVQCYMGRRPSFKLARLKLGQKLWFRVRSVGQTLSAWSAPALVVVR